MNAKKIVKALKEAEAIIESWGMPRVSVGGRDTSWAGADDKTIKKLYRAYLEGEIDLRSYWGVGDVRKVPCSLVPAGFVEWVITDDAPEYELHNGEKATFTVDTKNTLGIDMAMSGADGDYFKSDIHRWLNDEFAKASGIPLSPFVVRDKGEKHECFLTLRSEYELFGENIHSEQSNFEYNQPDYYKITRNRIKCEKDDYGESDWYWERSPYYGNGYAFCRVYSNGNATADTASNTYGLAPIGCL